MKKSKPELSAARGKSRHVPNRHSHKTEEGIGSYAYPDVSESFTKEVV